MLRIALRNLGYFESLSTGGYQHLDLIHGSLFAEDAREESFHRVICPPTPIRYDKSAVAPIVRFDKGDVRIASELFARSRQHANEGIVLRLDHQRGNGNAVDPAS